jgi:hypothetical protein
MCCYVCSEALENDEVDGLTDNSSTAIGLLYKEASLGVKRP